jgi:hypothetical protein
MVADEAAPSRQKHPLTPSEGRRMKYALHASREFSGAIGQNHQNFRLSDVPLTTQCFYFARGRISICGLQLQRRSAI